MVSFPADKVAVSRRGGEGPKPLLKTPGLEHFEGIGENLDAGSDFANGRCSFEDSDIMTSKEDSNGSTQATKACTHDDYLTDPSVTRSEQSHWNTYIKLRAFGSCELLTNPGRCHGVGCQDQAAISKQSVPLSELSA